jgi:predicted CoA-substrate-specific enzyme activase
LNNRKLLAGLDIGHVNTKAVLMRGQEILGYDTVPTGFDVVAAARTALHRALDKVGVSRQELAEIAATGIFRERIKASPLNITRTAPDYVSAAKGAYFLNRDSRTIIDIGGNIQKAVHYSDHGDLLDVVQNDKCADGLGIFYTTIARALGLSEQELSELALSSTRHVSVAIHCAASAESEAIGLLCQGVEVADVADAVTRFIVERVAAMASTLPLTREIVVAGGLAKSRALMKHLPVHLRKEVGVLNLPEYVGAIGAAMSC